MCPMIRIFRQQPLKRKKHTRLAKLPAGLKRCTKCRKIYLLDAFAFRGKTGTQATKRRAICKNCHRKHSRLAYACKTGLSLFKTRYAILRSGRPYANVILPETGIDPEPTLNPTYK